MFDALLPFLLMRSLKIVFKKQIKKQALNRKQFCKCVDFALPCEISFFRDQTIITIKANWVRDQNHKVESAHQCWGGGLEFFPRPPCFNIGGRIPLNVWFCLVCPKTIPNILEYLFSRRCDTTSREHLTVVVRNRIHKSKDTLSKRATAKKNANSI